MIFYGLERNWKKQCCEMILKKQINFGPIVPDTGGMESDTVMPAQFVDEIIERSKQKSGGQNL